MIKLKEIYNKIIKEIEPQEYEIYSDMDGVLVDFNARYKDLTGKDPFGLNQYDRELMEDFKIEDIKPITKSVEKQEEVRIFNRDCGCDKT